MSDLPYWPAYSGGFSGGELLKIYKQVRPRVSQRQLANILGIPFDAMHGRIYREQQKEKQTKEFMLQPQAKERVFLEAAVFDIETTDFVASGMNHLVCCSILPLSKDEITTIKIEFSDNRCDKRAIAEVIETLKYYDILIGHNIAAFDFNWLNSRLAFHGLDVTMKHWLYYDTYQAARRLALKADRKSLAFLCDFFQVPYEKTSILPVAWGKIDSSDEAEFSKALDSIVYHCEKDVFSNRNLFDALWPLDRSMTNLPTFKK